MKLVVIEDRVLKLTEKQFAKIKKVNDSGDENAMIEFLEKQESDYKVVGYISLSFRQ